MKPALSLFTSAACLLAAACSDDPPAMSASASTTEAGTTTSTTTMSAPTTGPDATTTQTTSSTSASTTGPEPTTTSAPTTGPDPTTSDESTTSETASTTEGALPECGNGVIDAGEACDDGDLSDDDACTAACQDAVCGDGLVWTGMEECDGGPACDADCTWSTCGDGKLDPGEQCDDGNEVTLDGCESTCKPTLMQIDAGELFTCVALGTGAVRCWGDNEYGQLGLGHTDILGDEPGEMPTPDLDLGGPVERIALGPEHACALMQDGAVRCWGRNDGGQLGHGNTSNCGDEPGEMPPPVVPLGEPAVGIAAGWRHTCALLASGALNCWGDNTYGQLGLGDVDRLGDEPGELPPPAVPIGAGIDEVFAGYRHNCVRMGTEVRCWGFNNQGELGYGHNDSLGDDPGELPTAVVPVGGPAASLAGGAYNTCVVRTDGLVHYWGSNQTGALGMGIQYGLGGVAGDLPTAPVPIGGNAVTVDSRWAHSCALLDTGAVRCWGANGAGMLGYGHVEALGDEPGELPTGDVSLGGPVRAIAVGMLHACVILVNGGVRCWGYGNEGELGLGNDNVIGDNELPDAAPLVPVI